MRRSPVERAPEVVERVGRHVVDANQQAAVSCSGPRGSEAGVTVGGGTTTEARPMLDGWRPAVAARPLQQAAASRGSSSKRGGPSVRTRRIEPGDPGGTTRPWAYRAHGGCPALARRHHRPGHSMDGIEVISFTGPAAPDRRRALDFFRGQLIAKKKSGSRRSTF